MSNLFYMMVLEHQGKQGYSKTYLDVYRVNHKNGFHMMVQLTLQVC